MVPSKRELSSDWCCTHTDTDPCPFWELTIKEQILVSFPFEDNLSDNFRWEMNISSTFFGQWTSNLDSDFYITCYNLFSYLFDWFQVRKLETNWLTLMNNSMVGSLSELCRSAMSSLCHVQITAHLKLFLDQSHWFCISPKKSSRLLWNQVKSALELALLLSQCVFVVVYIRRMCTSSQPVCFVWGLLGGCHAEHTLQVRRKREDPQNGRGTLLYIPNA